MVVVLAAVTSVLQGCDAGQDQCGDLKKEVSDLKKELSTCQERLGVCRSQLKVCIQDEKQLIDDTWAACDAKYRDPAALAHKLDACTGDKQALVSELNSRTLQIRYGALPLALVAFIAGIYTHKWHRHCAERLRSPFTNHGATAPAADPRQAVRDPP